MVQALNFLIRILNIARTDTDTERSGAVFVQHFNFFLMGSKSYNVWPSQAFPA